MRDKQPCLSPCPLLDGCFQVIYREVFRAQRWWSPLDPYFSGMKMNKSEMKTYRDKLVALRDRHNGDASHLADEGLRRTAEGGGGNLSNMPIHMADLGTDNFEQEFTLSLLQNEEQVLGEISAALDRIKQGSFGRCEECEGEIPRQRLEAVPYARYCVECARKAEQNQ